ncbi:MAG: hypothetical protein ACKODH_14300 [Limisphaerales bacterium]
MLPLLCILFAALASPALAQKQKSTDLAGFPLLWSAKKNPLTGPFIPGLNAALLLSDEQKEKLLTAREETMGNEKLQSLGAKVKLNPNASEAERDAARKVYEEARDQFKARMENILNSEQRKLVERLNGIFDEALTAAQEAYRGQLEQVVKTDKAKMEELRHELREKGLKDFKARLEGTLTKEQWAALTKAAEAEEAVAKNSAKVKKN